MHGHGWLSMFRLRGVERRPDGTYIAAFVLYEAPSPLTYSELLVARVLDRRQVEITDIWVDSVPSRDGGRALWAIPKDLCDFTLEHRHTGVVSRASWSASTDRSIATASFTDLSRLVPRLPFSGLSTRQPPLPDATSDPGLPDADGSAPVTAVLRGSARTMACRGAWDFAPTGPLGWLRGQRQVASFRMADFTMLFGV
jgi:acetoacetate decarboxylase